MSFKQGFCSGTTTTIFIADFMENQQEIFGDIALSLSGGGYRAAAFHLGTLEMLNKLGLLDQVKYLSTVSGGSITGAYYAAFRSELKDQSYFNFNDFKQGLFEFMASINVVEDGLNGLKPDTGQDGKTRTPSLIRAAASVYNSKELLNGKTFENIDNNRGHLEELIINSTDFRSSGSFRFVSTSNPKVHSGRDDTFLDRDVAKKVRLADAVAASACFPSGFEPIRFPSDFVWPDAQFLERIKNDPSGDFREERPLMDGGVFDNQGIDSIENVLDRADSQVRLYIVSDTSPRNDKPFKFPLESSKGFLTIRAWCVIVVLFTIASAISACIMLWNQSPYTAFRDLGYFRGLLGYYLPLALLISIVVGVLYGAWKFRGLMKWAEKKTGIELTPVITRLTIPALISLVSGRIKSLVEMSTNTFMARIRLMGYKFIHADPKIRPFVMPNLIYDIDNEKKWNKPITDFPDLLPKATIRGKARQAESYKTNLWFLDRDDLENLVECGQATVCFKLLKFLLKNRSAQLGLSDSPESAFFERVTTEWADFNK